VLGSIIFTLTAFVRNVFELMVSRVAAGAFTAVQAAVVGMVAASTPRKSLAFATGTLQGALAVGLTVGPLLGGYIYDVFGLKAAFIGNGVFLGASAVLVFFFVKERFVPPETANRSPWQPFRDMAHMATSREMLPLFALTFFVTVGSLLVFPALPLLAADLRGDTSNAATAAGVVFMALGFAQVASSFGIGWLGGRFGPRRVVPAACVITSILFLAPYFTDTVLSLTITMALVTLFQGGLLGGTNALIALTAQPGKHGSLFGALQAVTAFGIALGPLVGGAAAELWGLRSVFLVAVVLYAFISVAAVVLLRTRSTRAGEAVAG
jgi:DHA1 family multidrug resistance protein-like MFS transporter